MFGWSHVVPVPPRPPAQNPSPQYFIICLYEPGTHTCSNTPSRWWIDASTHRTYPIYQGIPQQVAGYQYRFEPADRMTGDQLDRPMQWTVGACATSRLGSCAFAPPLEVWLSSKNLRAANVSDFSTTQRLDVIGEVDNLGSTESGTFTSTLLAIPAVWDLDNDRCETDVNVSGVDRALTNRGVVLDLTSLPLLADDKIDVGNHVVVAVYSSSTPAIPATNTFSAIPPGATGTAVYLSAANPTTPAAWATILSVDNTNAIVEFDESDNHYGDCQEIR